MRTSSVLPALLLAISPLTSSAAPVELRLGRANRAEAALVDCGGRVALEVTGTIVPTATLRVRGSVACTEVLIGRTAWRLPLTRAFDGTYGADFSIEAEAWERDLPFLSLAFYSPSRTLPVDAVIALPFEPISPSEPSCSGLREADALRVVCAKLEERGYASEGGDCRIRAAGARSFQPSALALCARLASGTADDAKSAPACVTMIREKSFTESKVESCGRAIYPFWQVDCLRTEGAPVDCGQ